MTISNFEIGKCYSTFSLSQNRMGVMKGDDFNYKLVVYNDGYYHIVDNNYMPPSIIEDYFEINM